MAKLMNPLIPEPELMQWCGYKRRNALINWLESHGIAYLIGNGGIICTTYNAVNQAFIQLHEDQSTSTIDIDFL